jgi:hypothetical protein
VANSGTVRAGTLSLGHAVGGNQLVVSNSGMATVGVLYVGNETASNQVLVTDSGALAAMTLLVGANNGAGNQMVVSNAATVIVTNQLQITTGIGYSNSVTLAGGSLWATNGIVLNYNSGGYAALILNLGLLNASSLTGGGSGQVIFNGGTWQSGGTTYGNATPLVVGDGTDAAVFQMLSSPTHGDTHSFAGGLIISSNALLSGSGTINGNVSVNGGSFLNDSGTVNGNLLINGGTFAPGTNQAWSLTVTGGLVLSNGCTTLVGLSPGSASANNVRGVASVVYGGALQLTNLDGPYPFVPGRSYKLFSAVNYSGTFSQLLPPPCVGTSMS